MRRVAISASSRAGADAGVVIADQGGNAVDAAIAATVAAMISDPGIIGPGAGCFLTIWPAAGDPIVIDGYAAMPGLGGAGPSGGFGDRVHMEYGGGMDTLVGARSVAVPGVWAGLGRAGDHFGVTPWSKLMAPAVSLAATGFEFSGVSEAYLAYAHDPIYDREPDSFAALHHPDGNRVAQGDPVIVAGLAESLSIIAAEGPSSFYTGTIGQRLVAAMKQWGGHITADDLEAYVPIERTPITVDFAGWKIATNPAPAIGGAVLASILLLLDASGFSEWSPESARTMAEIQRAVLAHRADVLDHASDVDAAVTDLLAMAGYGDHRALGASPSTIHVSCVDTDGLACSVTTSAGYGSGLMIPDTGLWLNNSLGEVELFPAGMEMFAPGARLPSNMAPTIASGPGGAALAVGSPGASRITTALAQVLANFIALEMSVSDAVDHPRLHVEVFRGEPTIAYEPGIHPEPFDGLSLRRFPDRSMYFGGVGLAMFDPAAGLYEVADPRRTGATAVGGL
jgi:gamma-glutamyltranspeptidase / glutathione hydrolase